MKKTGGQKSRDTLPLNRGYLKCKSFTMLLEGFKMYKSKDRLHKITEIFQGKKCINIFQFTNSQGTRVFSPKIITPFPVKI